MITRSLLWKWNQTKEMSPTEVGAQAGEGAQQVAVLEFHVLRHEHGPAHRLHAHTQPTQHPTQHHSTHARGRGYQRPRWEEE